MKKNIKTTSGKSWTGSPVSSQLTESKLRAYNKCSQFSFYGGEVEFSIKTKLLEYLYSKIVLDVIKGTYTDLAISINKHLYKADTELDLNSKVSHTDLFEYKRHIPIQLTEIFTLIPLQKMVPLFGPYKIPLQISNTNIDIGLSSIYSRKYHDGVQERRMYYEAVMFSPYSSEHSMVNDLVARANILTLTRIYAGDKPKRPNFPYIKLHIFNASSGMRVNYSYITVNSSTPLKQWATSIENVVKLYEQGYHYPLIPCPHSCPYKEKCTPYEEN